MANLIKGVQREQLALFELRIEDMISQDNEVRVIDAFIDSLDLESLGFQKVVANEVGTNHYDDKDLLKLYIYAYRHKARSSRKIEELCKVNVEVIWLLRGIVPNFRTISDFQKEHVKDIKKVFFELIKFAKELDLRKKMNPKSKRKRKTKKCITAILTPKKEDIKVRMQTSEHVHGTMKRADDMSYFLLKGKEKVNGELGLYYIGTNLRRMANIMGVTKLVEKIKDKIARKSEIYG